MDATLKQDFTRRISNSNRGELIVVIYDIFFAYAKEARSAFEKKEYEEFKSSLRKAQQAVTQLKEGLDFRYPVAKELYPLYRFAQEQLASCFYRPDLTGLDAAEAVLKNLYVGFVEAAKQDSSEPLMKHTQQVVAGMTYQRGSLTETLQDPSSSRGFFA